MIPRFLPALSAVLLFAASSLPAAPPDVKALFPAGGQRGTSVEVRVTGKLPPEAQLWASGEGITAAVGEKGDTVTLTLAPEMAPGLYWLRFYTVDGAAPLRPFVVGTLPEVVEKEPNNAPAAAQALDGSQVVVNGVLSKNEEVDTFAVPLKAGQTLVASMDAHRTLGSPMDGVLQIVSPRGFVLAQNDDDHGFDPQIVYEAEVDGTYLVRTFAFPATPNSSIRLAGGADYLYRLTLTTGPFADHALPMTVQTGASASMRPVGWNIPDDLAAVPVAVRDGHAVLTDPRLGNTLALPTAPHAAVVESPRAADAPPQEVARPVTITGCLTQPAETDAYRFTGKKGENLAVRCVARQLGGPLDPVVRLVGPDGKTVREVDDSSRNVADPELSLALPADGEYQVQVTDRHRRGGFRFVYCLSLETPTPDFSLAVAGDAFTLKPGSPLAISVTVARANKFDGEIEITLSGLPEGITATAVKSEAKGATAKEVKLSVSGATEMPWSGLVRITGKAADHEHAATAPLPTTGGRTPELWLTFPGTAKGK